MSHLILDIGGCEPDLLKSECFLRTMISVAVDIAGMTMVECLSYRIGDGDLFGITAFAVLKESHMSCHTWPQNNFIAIDLFSCKEFDDRAVSSYLLNILGPNTFIKKIEVISREI